MSPFRGFVRHVSLMSAQISILFSQTDRVLPPLEGVEIFTYFYTHWRNPISTDARLHDHIPIILALQTSPFPLRGDS